MTVNASKDWIQELYVKEFIRPKRLPTDFYYNNDGRIVMTESYHINRGSCCGNKCLHCCYSPPHVKGNKTLKESLLS
jgi:hypothetical protein